MTEFGGSVSAISRNVARRLEPRLFYFSTAGAAGAGSMHSERGMILAGLQRTLSVKTAYDEDLWC